MSPFHTKYINIACEFDQVKYITERISVDAGLEINIYELTVNTTIVRIIKLSYAKISCRLKYEFFRLKFNTIVNIKLLSYGYE